MNQQLLGGFFFWVIGHRAQRTYKIEGREVWIPDTLDAYAFLFSAFVTHAWICLLLILAFTFLLFNASFCPGNAKCLGISWIA